MNDILGFMLPDELDILSTLLNDVPKNGKLVELGSLFGRTAVHYATLRPDVTILCIDDFVDNYWEDLLYPGRANRPLNNTHYKTYDMFLSNTKNFNNISHMRCKCPEGITYTGEDINLLFVDLAHANPIDWESIQVFLPYIAQGGIICGHDYNPNLFPDVVENVARLEKIYNTTATIFNEDYKTVWSIRI